MHFSPKAIMEDMEALPWELKDVGLFTEFFLAQAENRRMCFWLDSTKEKKRFN